MGGGGGAEVCTLSDEHEGDFFDFKLLHMRKKSGYCGDSREKKKRALTTEQHYCGMRNKEFIVCVYLMDLCKKRQCSTTSTISRTKTQ